MGYYREVGLGYPVAPCSVGVGVVDGMVGVYVVLTSSRVVLLDLTGFLDFFVTDFFVAEDLS